MPTLFFNTMKKESLEKSELRSICAYYSFASGPIVKLSTISQDGCHGFSLKFRDTYTLTGDQLKDKESLAIITEIMINDNIVSGQFGFDVAETLAPYDSLVDSIFIVSESPKTKPDAWLTYITVTPAEIRLLYPKLGTSTLDAIGRQLIMMLDTPVMTPCF